MNFPSSLGPISTEYVSTEIGIPLQFAKRASKRSAIFQFTTTHATCIWLCHSAGLALHTLRLRQNGCRFAYDSFKCIFFSESVWISIKISLQFVPRGSVNNIPALAWHRPGDKSLSEPIIVSLLTHICVTRPQWVNTETVFSNMTISVTITESTRYIFHSPLRSVTIWYHEENNKYSFRNLQY